MLQVYHHQIKKTIQDSLGKCLAECQTILCFFYHKAYSLHEYVSVLTKTDPDHTLLELGLFD
jgi:hypothetical protein